MAADDNDFLEKKDTTDWFDSIKDMLENPTIPQEWLDYLKKIYAYIEIGAPPNSPSKKQPTILTKIEKSGWTLHDYGDRIAVSSGDYAHGLRESDRVGGNPSPGYGTIVAQSWNSAEAIIQLAQQRWPDGSQLLSGTPFMQFAAGYWVYFSHYTLDGLALHKSDELAYLQIKNLLGEKSTIGPLQHPT